MRCLRRLICRPQPRRPKREIAGCRCVVGNLGDFQHGAIRLELRVGRSGGGLRLIAPTAFRRAPKGGVHSAPCCLPRTLQSIPPRSAAYGLTHDAGRGTTFGRSSTTNTLGIPRRRACPPTLSAAHKTAFNAAGVSCVVGFIPGSWVRSPPALRSANCGCDGSGKRLTPARALCRTSGPDAATGATLGASREIVGYRPSRMESRRRGHSAQEARPAHPIAAAGNVVIPTGNRTLRSSPSCASQEW